MACQIEKVQAILSKLEKNKIDVSELKAQVNKKIAEKQAIMSFSEAFKKERASAIKWLAKEEAKYKAATQAISDGVYDSTAGFIKRFYGDRANSGSYTKDDVIYLSTNGNRKGRLAPVINDKLQGAYTNIDRAIEAGASFVADTSSHLKSTSKYNIGEVELADYLASKGYTREDKPGYGLWTKQNSVVTKSANTISSLKWDDRNNTMVSSDGKTKVKVNTLEELTTLSEEYHDLLSSKLGAKNVDYNKHKEYYLGLFNQLKDAGIVFKPVTIHFTKTVKGDMLGSANSTNNEIELSTSKILENRYLLKVVLHEYAHILTVNELKKYPELNKRTREIMDNVLRQFPDLAIEYGFTDEYEFIAEVMSSTRFQTQLAAVKSDGKSSIVDKIKKIFSYLLSKVNTKEVNALTDALEVVAGLTDINKTQDNALIKSDLGIIVPNEAFRDNVNKKIECKE